MDTKIEFGIAPNKISFNCICKYTPRNRLGTVGGGPNPTRAAGSCSFSLLGVINWE